DRNASGVGLREADDAPEGRRFARAVRAEEGEALAGVDVEIEPIEDRPRSECLGDPGQREHESILRKTANPHAAHTSIASAPRERVRGAASGRSSMPSLVGCPLSLAASSRPAAAGLWRKMRATGFAPSMRSNAPAIACGASPTPSPSKSKPR